MKQLHDLDFENASLIRNHILPTSNNDGVSKEYADRKRALYKTEYITITPQSLVKTNAAFTDIIDATLQSSNAPYSLLYTITLTTQLVFSTGLRACFELYYGFGAGEVVIAGVVVSGLSLQTQNIDYTFVSIIPPNETIRLRWRLLAAGGSVTYTFSTGYTYLSLTGFHTNLFTLP